MGHKGGTNPPLHEVDLEQLAAFRYALRRFLRFAEESARTAGLTPQQYQALLAIAGIPGRSRLTVGELAERLQLHHHSTVGLVDRLEAHGLVARRGVPGDRRQVAVVLTDAGLDAVIMIASANHEELLAIAPEMRRALDHMIENGRLG